MPFEGMEVEVFAKLFEKRNNGHKDTRIEVAEPEIFDRGRRGAVAGLAALRLGIDGANSFGTGRDVPEAVK